MNRHLRPTFAVFLFLLAPAGATGEEYEITKDALMAHVHELASESLRGRRAGTAFERRAADYAARALQSLGVAPLPSGERMQTFSLADGDDAPTSVNVLGVVAPPGGGRLEGVVVLGAHLDHLGPAPDGGFFAGADDNASGAAVALEVAGALRHEAERLRRPVVVVLFGAEEIGLIGSRRFVDSGPIDADEIALMVNLDMLGRPLLDQAGFGWLKTAAAIDDSRAIGVIGCAGRPFFVQTVEAACARHGIRAYGHQALLSPLATQLAKNRSDHSPFEQVGVPTLFFSSGESDDYHRPSDTPETLHPALLALRAKVIRDVVFECATAEVNKLPRRAAAEPRRP